MAATYNGFVGDTAFTAPVGEISDDVKQLIRVTEECLALAIEQCHPNKRVGDIAWAVQSHAEKYVTPDTASDAQCTKHRRFRITEDREQKKNSAPDIVSPSSRCSISERTKQRLWTTNGRS
jgi:methionine aminopeptidase